MIVAFSITPLGVGEGVGNYVADAVRVVRDSGLPNRTDAMFTSVEGDWDEVMDVVRRAVDAVAAQAPRVSLVLKADIRRRLLSLPTVKELNVEVVFEPPWHPGRMTEGARLQLGLDLETTSFPMY